VPITETANTPLITLTFTEKATKGALPNGICLIFHGFSLNFVYITLKFFKTRRS
jgi:hypothetical protein